METVSALVLLLHLLTISLCSACPCSTTNSLRVGCQKQFRHLYRPHYHDNRGLYGSCLPNTQPNTMMCYKWSTRICLNQDGAKEECKLSPKSTTSTQGVSVHDGGRRYTLYSPGFNRPNNYNRFFCIYNITLNCPGHKVNLAATERTTPFQADCNDYLAIYTDRNSRTPDRKICGRDFHHYRTTLDTNHFHGVFWTDYETSPGRFEIEATCAEPIPTTSTSSATTSDEGSAAGDIIGDNI